MTDPTSPVVLIGGPFDGRRCELSATPVQIDVAGLRYARLDDPDTGDFLDGYALVSAGVTADV